MYIIKFSSRKRREIKQKFTKLNLIKINCSKEFLKEILDSQSYFYY